MTYTRNLRTIVLLTVLLALMAVSASAGPTIWGGTTNYLGYYVDPASGATLPAPNGILTFGASSSPYSGWVFVTSPINLWKVPVMAAGTPEGLGPYSTVPMTDLAFDSGSGTLYGIADPFMSGELYTIDYSCPGYGCMATSLGVSMPLVQGIDFVPGRGIYGADINGTLWRLDPKTLQLSLVGDTGVSGITETPVSPTRESCRVFGSRRQSVPLMSAP